MHIGLIGLGRMGGNMRERLRRGGHEVTGYDRDPGVSDVGSLAELAEALPSPKVVWVMVPAGGPTHDTIAELAGLLAAGDLVVDGGNSRWTDDQQHAATLAEKGIGFVDCGVSGGVWGLENGYGLMCGGADDQVELAQPIFDTLKPPGESGSDLTAWPPNCCRIAAIAFIAGDSSCREANRANSEAAIAFIGTAWSIAASTVHRPSPESSA